MANTPTAPARIVKTAKIKPYAVAERLLAAAYSDCHERHLLPFVPERNLRFCCPVTVTVPEAQRLLRRYVSGYNVFEPKLLKGLPPDCRVRLAREGSVCLYVDTMVVLNEEHIRRELRCDEFDLYQVLGDVRSYRLWWD